MTWTTDGLDMDPRRRAVGRARLERFITHQAMTQMECLSLTLSVATAPGAGYSDRTLEAILADADDLVAAAEAWATSCRALVSEWREQRIAEEGRRDGDTPA